MTSTTVRVDTRTHSTLVELSEQAGASLVDTVRDAAEALRRQRFLDDARKSLDELRKDPVAWDDYVNGYDEYNPRPPSVERDA